jgi:hypothetical protein
MTSSDAAASLTSSTPRSDELPIVTWLSMVKRGPSYAVIRAKSCGKELIDTEVLHGPLSRKAAAAALRVALAREFVLNRGS